MVRVRYVLNVALVVTAVGVLLYVLLPRFRNAMNCDSSVPLNAAQTAGLADARMRKAGTCAGPQQQCKFDIQADQDGAFHVSLHFVKMYLFEGCVWKGQDVDVYFYSREGRYIRTEGAPFG